MSATEAKQSLTERLLSKTRHLSSSPDDPDEYRSSPVSTSSKKSDAKERIAFFHDLLLQSPFKQVSIEKEKYNLLLELEDSVEAFTDEASFEQLVDDIGEKVFALAFLIYCPSEDEKPQKSTYTNFVAWSFDKNEKRSFKSWNKRRSEFKRFQLADDQTICYSFPQAGETKWLREKGFSVKNYNFDVYFSTAGARRLIRLALQIYLHKHLNEKLEKKLTKVAKKSKQFSETVLLRKLFDTFVPNESKQYKPKQSRSCAEFTKIVIWNIGDYFTGLTYKYRAIANVLVAAYIYHVEHNNAFGKDVLTRSAQFLWTTSELSALLLDTSPTDCTPNERHLQYKQIQLMLEETQFSFYSTLAKDFLRSKVFELEKSVKYRQTFIAAESIRWTLWVKNKEDDAVLKIQYKFFDKCVEFLTDILRENNPGATLTGATLRCNASNIARVTVNVLKSKPNKPKWLNSEMEELLHESEENGQSENSRLESVSSSSDSEEKQSSDRLDNTTIKQPNRNDTTLSENVGSNQVIVENVAMDNAGNAVVSEIAMNNGGQIENDKFILSNGDVIEELEVSPQSGNQQVAAGLFESLPSTSKAPTGDSSITVTPLPNGFILKKSTDKEGNGVESHKTEVIKETFDKNLSPLISTETHLDNMSASEQSDDNNSLQFENSHVTNLSNANLLESARSSNHSAGENSLSALTASAESLNSELEASSELSSEQGFKNNVSNSSSDESNSSESRNSSSDESYSSSDESDSFESNDSSETFYGSSESYSSTESSLNSSSSGSSLSSSDDSSSDKSSSNNFTSDESESESSSSKSNTNDRTVQSETNVHFFSTSESSDGGSVRSVSNIMKQSNNFNEDAEDSLNLQTSLIDQNTSVSVNDYL